MKTLKNYNKARNAGRHIRLGALPQQGGLWHSGGT